MKRTAIALAFIGSLLILLVPVVNAPSSSSSTPSEPPPVEWEKTLGSGGIDWASQIIQTADGGYAVLGSFSDYIGYTFHGHDALVKIDSSGNTEWEQTVRGNDGVVQTSDGGYTIVGSGDGGVMLSKTDSKGVSQWNQTYKVLSQDKFGKVVASLVRTKDGGYAIAGNTGSYLNVEPPNQALLILASSWGKMIWSKTYGKPDHINFFRSVIQTRDSEYVLAGSTSDGAGGTDFWLFKTDSMGNSLWSKTYGGNGDDDAKSLVQTSDGGYAIVGSTNSFGAGDSSQAWLVKTDSSGNLQWTRTYDGSAASLIQTSDGGLAFAGSQKDNAWLVKTDSVGNVEWNQTFGNLHWTGYAGDRNSVSANSVIETEDGGFAIAATLRSPRYSRGGFYWYLAKTGPALPSSSVPPASLGPAPFLAFPSITIKADGNVEPSSAPVERNGNVYIFKQNLNGPLVVEKDNIVVDGVGYSLQGNGTIAELYIRVTETGIDLTGRTNVTVKNMQIDSYQYGILLDGSDNITISGNTVIQNRQGISVTRSAYTSIRENNITRNYEGIFITASASNNKISGNNIFENSATGITLKNANGNVIFGNNIRYNGNGGGDMSGIFIASGSNNLIVGNVLYSNFNGVSMSGSTEAIIAGNNITKCSQGIFGQNSSGTVIYMNNFNNTNPNDFTDEGINFWDNGTIGNYWSDYIQKYPNAKEKDTTGIWDTPYVITHFGPGEDNTYQFMETNNTDHYPLLIPISNAAASALAEVLVMAHSPSPMPAPSSSAIDLLLVAALTVVAVALVLVAVVVLRRRKKRI